MVGFKALETERNIYPKAAKGFDLLRKSSTLFEEYLKDGDTAGVTDYYKARKMVKEGEAHIKDALKNAKKLLGPLPPYVTDEYKQWRKNFLEKHRVLAASEDFSDLEKELLQDEYLLKWLTPDEIVQSLHLVFPRQTEGKRRLANIKVRIILDKLDALLSHVKELQKQALLKHQQL